jgi:hypothetical protein
MDGNPFAALSLIVAPAILTNASSVLALSTSNRLARAVDRARELARQLNDANRDDGQSARRLSELSALEQRAGMLLRVLQSFYIALGAFASAALISLIGAVLVPVISGPLGTAIEALAVVAGTVAVGALVRGSIILVAETRIAVQVLRDGAADVRARLRRQ